MFDWVNYECVCPQCHAKVDKFQSKSGKCLMDELEPTEVDNFYSSCKRCGCWLEVTEKDISHELVVTSARTGSKVLHTKGIKIPFHKVTDRR